VRRIALVTLALAGLAASVATPALADAPGDNSHGLICQFASVEDPTAEPGTQSGQLSGGPVVLLDGANAPESGTLTCSIQVDNPIPGGSGPSVSGHSTGVFTAGPAVVNYVAPATSNVYLCSSFTDDSDSLTYYFQEATGTWTTTAADAPCGLAEGSNDPSETDILIDSIVCPVLAIVFPPTGDVVLPDPIGKVWDCPPYGV
jgi:hypothetical protein